jgi:hypothetical protein
VKTVAAPSSETPSTTYQTTQWHNTQVHNIRKYSSSKTQLLLLSRSPAICSNSQSACQTNGRLPEQGTGPSQHTSMSREEFEPTIPVLGQSKTVRALTQCGHCDKKTDILYFWTNKLSIGPFSRKPPPSITFVSDCRRDQLSAPYNRTTWWHHRNYSNYPRTSVPCREKGN